MELELLQRLIALMKESELSELEFENEQLKVRIARRLEPAAAPAPPLAGNPAPIRAPAAQPAAAAGLAPGILEFRAPMVGTFYRAPSPEAEPYVEAGDHVGPETVLCMLEAMKVMNEIKAECSGEVVAVLAENGEPVEYGQPLFHIRTA